MTQKILCIGEALIDMICTDKGSPLSEGLHFLKKAGGAPTNVAAAISALGGEAELAAKVGTDPFGNHLVQVMKDFGVSTRWMLQAPDHFTTFAFVSLLESGERDFYFNRGADGQLSENEVASIDLSEYSILHFGSATAFLPGPLQEAYRSLLHKCRSQKIFISFDPNYRHLLFRDNTDSFIQQSKIFIENCHFFKVSDEEAMLLTGCDTVEKASSSLMDSTAASFAITLGKEGTLLCRDGQSALIGSIPVKPVDTTGAGDAFVGAVLHQLNRFSFEEKIRLPAAEWQSIVFNANKAGARTCEFMGAMEAFKHLSSDIFK